jgi:hypothetical protein
MKIARRQFLVSSTGGIAVAIGVGEQALALAPPQVNSSPVMGTLGQIETNSAIRRENCSFANEMLRQLQADVEDGLAPLNCERVHHCPLCNEVIRVQLPREADRRTS